MEDSDQFKECFARWMEEEEKSDAALDAADEDGSDWDDEDSP